MTIKDVVEILKIKNQSKNFDLNSTLKITTTTALKYFSTNLNINKLGVTFFNKVKHISGTSHQT